MAGEPALYARMELRIAEFEKNIMKAVRTADRGMGEVEKRTATARARVESQLGGMFKAFGQGLLAGAAAGGIAGLGKVVQDVARGMAEIGDQARRAGLSTKAFQELGYVAKQNRIGVDSLVDGIRELNIRADEWAATGGGPAAEAFQRLGYTAESLREKLKDPSALFTEIIGKLGQLDRASQIRIADEIFGGGAGEKFVQLIGQGEEGIRATIQAANDLGIVIDDQLIRKADELDRKFQAVVTTVGTALKTAIVEAASSLQSFVESFREVQDRSTVILEGRLAELMTRRGQLEKQKGTLEDSALALIGKDAATELKAIDEEMTRIAAELRKRALPKLREELLKNAPAGTDGVSSGKGDRLSNLPASTDIVPTARVDPYFSDAGSAAGDAMAMAFIKKFEGYSGSAYWDTNAWRVGYGSDTTTGADGSVSQVLQTTLVSVADANRDLARRIGEFQLSIVNAIGADTWNAFTEEQKAALTSITYNYGELPQKIVDAILSHGDVGAAIRGLGSDNGGVNRKRRNAEADLFNGGSGSGELVDNWEGLREVTSQTVDATAMLQQQYAALGQIGVTAIQGLASALADGKITASELLGILAQILQQLLSMPTAGGGTLLGSIVGAIFGGGGGGLAGGVTAGGVGLWHGGGVVGQASMHRHGVNPAMFAGAPRFHGGGFPGLRAGEVPAILERGEVVLPRGYRNGRDDNYGGVSIHYNPMIDNRGASIEAVARLERIMMKERATFDSRVITAVRDGRRDRRLRKED